MAPFAQAQFNAILDCRVATDTGPHAGCDPGRTSSRMLETLQMTATSHNKLLTSAREEPIASLETVEESQAKKIPDASMVLHKNHSPLTERWELEPEARHGLFSLRPHKQNYILFARYTDNVNSQPTSPTLGSTPPLPLDNTEVKFQLSFKAKALQGLFGNRADLWIGYTQQSSWQIYNRSQSSPFRETNYEPELMLAFRTNYDVLGLTGRFINLGLVHQSNGRAEPLSRSWNRLYAQFGFERDGFSLLFRPWYRIRESADQDNNPDITEYIGRGDLLAVYQWNGHTWSLLMRSNVNFWNFHGAAQLDWSFPLYGDLRGYVQGFTGYGETLID